MSSSRGENQTWTFQAAWLIGRKTTGAQRATRHSHVVAPTVCLAPTVHQWGRQRAEARLLLLEGQTCPLVNEIIPHTVRRAARGQLGHLSNDWPQWPLRG